MPWQISHNQQSYILILRLDTTQVRQETYAFIGRVALLILIIAVFVTIATMITLGSAIIEPIYLLREDLQAAGEAAGNDHQTPNFRSSQLSRNDELGEVITTFEQMFQRVSEAIAEQKQSKFALRLSEEKFAKAFRASPHPVIITSATEGQFIEVNDSFTMLFGYTSEEVIGRTAAELNLWVNPDDPSQLFQLMQRYYRIRNQEVQLRHKWGKILTVLFSVEMMTLNGQDCLLAVLNDVTERKRAQEALQESEEQFRTLVEQAADAIFVIDMQGKFVDVNPQACKNLGYTREELLKLSVVDIQTPLPAGGFAQLWQHLQQDEVITLDGIHQRKDGTTFPVEIRADLFEARGQKLVLAISRDISDRKQTEQALERLAEIGELATMIVHEVRNPLTTVLMALHAFEHLDLSDHDQLRLSLALDEAERLKRLLNEILLYARQQNLMLKTLEINTFIADELLDFVRTMPTASGRSIQFIPASQSATVLGDRDKLKQVFINLISNACEATSDGEEIVWQVECPTQTHKVCIWVHNKGLPIPPEILPKLTQPFFTTKPSGNGLGLAIVKRIAEAHGGELQIESTAIAGTTMKVYLPLVSIGD
jgi:PAS domain S-box-containing protein